MRTTHATHAMPGGVTQVSERDTQPRCEIKACVYQPLAWPLCGRHLVGLVVSVPQPGLERELWPWEYRELAQDDWITLPLGGGLRTSDLDRLRPYLEPNLGRVTR